MFLSVRVLALFRFISYFFACLLRMYLGWRTAEQPNEVLFMCMFPFTNTLYKSRAYKKGLREFDCGSCPECLAKKSRVWALRTCYEMKESKAGMMITLTYDQYVRDSAGKIVGESVAVHELSKRDVQLFIKKVRRHLSYNIESEARKKITNYINNLYADMPYNARRLACKSFRDLYKIEIKDYISTQIATYSPKIKYLVGAERGNSTNRPHYHIEIFGYKFPDCVKYKKSKRGNWIYTSATLNKIWNKGICTVDCLTLNEKTARYCTKYLAKDSGIDDTFQLFSKRIGENALYNNFNAKSYYIDGREYSVPKSIWNRYIFEIYGYRYSYRSLADCYKFAERKSVRDVDTVAFMLFDESRRFRERFMSFRDNLPEYQSYLAYWKNKADVYSVGRPSPIQRVLALPNDKYFGYKQIALYQLARRKSFGEESSVPPRCNCVSRFLRWRESILRGSLGPLAFLDKPFARTPLVIKGQMTQNDRKIRFNSDVIVYNNIGRARKTITLASIYDEKIKKFCPFDKYFQLST